MSFESNSLSDPREQKTYYFHETPTRRLVIGGAKIIFKIVSRSQVQGVENLPAGGPAVLAVNHLTNYDAFLVQFAMPRLIFFMGKEELFRNPGMDWLLRQLGGFPVYRGANDSWALLHAQRILEKGLVLGIFPEGSRSKGMGLSPAKTGAARLALAAGCPIVPMALSGSQNIFRHKFKRSLVSVQVGGPIYPEEDETPISLTERMMFKMAEMLPLELRGAYRYHPPGF